MANEVATKSTFSVALANSLEEIKESLPVGFNKTRYVQNAVYLLNNNEQLAKYAKQYGTANIKLALLNGARLDLDATKKEFYLIPYGADINLSIDYRGKIRIVKKYSTRPIKDIYAKIVREGDFFEEAIVGGETSITFKPKPFNNGAIIGCFAVCLFKDGGMICETMNVEELERVRSVSKAKNSPAWTKFTGEMYKKVVIHRLTKMIDFDWENAEQGSVFESDVEIENDPQARAEADIEENANTEVFDADAEVIDV